MPASPQELYLEVSGHARQTAVLASIEELLGWDERTMLPPAGGQHRAEQISLIAGLVHRRRTDPQLGQWLAALAESPLAADPHSVEGAAIRQLKRRYEKAVKLPQSLVEELSRTAVLAQQAWVEARRKSEFTLFRPWLEKMLALKRSQADALGWTESRYEPLLDDFEPDQRPSEVAAVLDELRQRLVPLVDAIRGSPRRPDAAILHRGFPVDVQQALGRQAAEIIGFDFDRGRLDVTVHPFCAGLGPDDCRITTRYNERFFNEAFFGILHEAGHGIYEQGLPADQYGLPPGEAVSLGIHESQSRLWENLVGRSRPFWEYFYPRLREAFPQALADVSLDAFYAAVNDVRPSLIRVEADEATYNLHILVRFELEQALLAGDLPAGDLPGAWNEKYQQYLGIEPPDDAQGVLQDVHWSAGLVGYFPTYSLGNLYACQFFARAAEELGNLDADFRRGQFGPLRQWLRENVHQYGQRYPAAELVRKVTGNPLSCGPLIEHLSAKLKPLYGLA